MFGGSQSATASVSANMHRIVEDVERLVESDVSEGIPAAPEHLSYLDNGGPPTPQARLFEPSLSASFHDQSVRRVGTPIAPPGLCPPITKPAISDQTLSQAFTPRPALPGIPSIWNTTLSPQAVDVSSPRTPRSPPGLGQRPLSSVMSGGNNSGFPSQELIANDLMHRRSLIGSSQLQSSLDQCDPHWLSSTPFPRHPFSGTSWKGDPFDGVNPYPENLSQPMNSSLVNSSWANNAFIASGLASGADYPNSGFGGTRKSASQLGAIGQTPPCGQGG